MCKPDKIYVEYETSGSGESDYYASVTGFEYKNRDVRDYGYFDGTFLAATPERELASELVEALREMNANADSVINAADLLGDYEEPVVHMEAQHIEDLNTTLLKARAVLAKLEGKGCR